MIRNVTAQQQAIIDERLRKQTERLVLWKKVNKLVNEGMSIAAIARRLGMSWETVSRIAKEKNMWQVKGDGP